MLAHGTRRAAALVRSGAGVEGLRGVFRTTGEERLGTRKVLPHNPKPVGARATHPRRNPTRCARMDGEHVCLLAFTLQPCVTRGGWVGGRADTPWHRDDAARYHMAASETRTQALCGGKHGGTSLIASSGAKTHRIAACDKPGSARCPRHRAFARDEHSATHDYPPHIQDRIKACARVIACECAHARTPISLCVWSMR